MNSHLHVVIFMALDTEGTSLVIGYKIWSDKLCGIGKGKT